MVASTYHERKDKLKGKSNRNFTSKCFILVIVLIVVIGTACYMNGLHQGPKESSIYDEIVSMSDNKGQTKQSRMLHNDILQTIEDKNLRSLAGPGISYGADTVWEEIMLKGGEIMKKNNYKERLVAVEVGAQSPTQSLQALRAKFEVICVEPSPKSYRRIEKTVGEVLKKKNDSADVERIIHLYNAAAGSTSEGTLDFRSTGGTGDHVGEIDMWNMKPGSVPEHWPEEKKGEIIKVQSIQMDDIIYDNRVKPTFSSTPTLPSFDSVYALKVDTQGFEPNVFAGLTKSIKEHKIKYIMTEYWPKGMGLMTDHMDDPCSIAVPILDTLTDAGYKLYALPVIAHPKAKHPTISVPQVTHWKKRPLDDYRSDCQNFLDYEKQLPNSEYHMGYWTDILAIAPGVEPFIPGSTSKSV
jgi:FkbM family methyltransferase